MREAETISYPELVQGSPYVVACAEDRKQINITLTLSIAYPASVIELIR